jgi:cytochrome c biogenesis protein CcmG/thiol:disulfide interchange protein DsbE
VNTGSVRLSIDRLAWVRDRRRWAAVVATVTVLGAIWIALSAVPVLATTGGRIPSPREGFLAPSFELSLPSGDAVDLRSLRGQVVVVNFWASWCPPCKAEMPSLERSYEAHQGQGLVILGVNTTYQDSLQAAVAFAYAEGVTFPILLDQDGETSRRYLVRALPTTFFIDRQGVIRHVVVGGPMSEATLTSTVRDLLRGNP